MIDWSRVIRFVVIVAILFVVLFLVWGCAFWRGFRPEKPAEPPEPIKQMYAAAKKGYSLTWFFILGAAVGLFAGLNGLKAGWAAVIACIAGLFMTLATARFPTWMALLGLVGSVLAAVASILLKSRALEQIIKGVQKIRVSADAEVKERVDTILSKEQDTSTKKLVKTVKNKLSLKGEIK